ncbi:Store-operated calcium entry-associated regulatory factor [Rhizoctonia solani]|uniref:Store-operated calcium entry-associated regulatory factor n=1 Tax=Rhizoctonia solani TaxID=456999 RepID=A0A0K6FX85_9AGAM|nr:Store-operated calcium entry-associated regulatory factor [Rhizoctonia solani]
MERVPLSSIKTLVLYADELTRSRRTSPVPQLECTGSVCRDFQPSSVYCTKAGHSDWKCEADLPALLRFGKLQVSCEGWDRPGDPYVLKGSCGLTYSLVRAPSGNYYPQSTSTDYTTYVLYIAAVLLALYVFLNWLRPRSFNSGSGRNWGSGTPGGGTNTGRGGGWPWGGGRGGGPNSSNDAPPPYSKHARPSRPNQNESWRPGFWTGLGAGGLAAGMYNYLTRPRELYRPAATAWDWDRSAFSSTGPYRPEPSAFRRRYEYDDSSAGSSTGPGTRLGEMRRATGYASTSVR